MSLKRRFARVLGAEYLLARLTGFVPPLVTRGWTLNGTDDLLTSLGAYLTAWLPENGCTVAAPGA